ncbi:MAG: hypothetical protein IJB11_07490 [Oscillospiraceae bacterium]|nr:hypothetical protein [Oscillospiraceae bacterium]
MRLLSILLLLIMLTGCAADTPAQTTAPEKAQEQEVSAMNITVADTRPSCLAIESGRCFYGEDEQGNFYRILWAETDALAEGIAVRVEYRDWKALKYPNGYPDGGYTPQYEVTAISVTPQSASPDAVRSAADAMLARRCHVTDLSGFVISTVTDERGRSFVEYGIPGGFYLVAVSAEGTAEYVFDGMEKYAEYLPLATPQAIRQADEKLSAQAPSGSYYFSVNDEGYLCLNAEVIVHFEPDPPADENELVMSGCGIDHEHLFFSERICPKP